MFKGCLWKSACLKQIPVATAVKSVFSNTSQHVASFQSCAKNSPAPAIPEYLYYKANPKAGKQQTFPWSWVENKL